MFRPKLIYLSSIISGIIVVSACSGGQMENSVIREVTEDETEHSIEFLEELAPADTTEDSINPASLTTEERTERKPLVVTIENLKSDTALVEMSIYASEESFLVKKAQMKKFRIKPTGHQLKIELSDVPYGEFAIAAYQDLDENNEINRNLVGLPSEPYAFSNNVKPKLKLPSFDECKFDYSDSSNTVSISLIH